MAPSAVDLAAGYSMPGILIVTSVVVHLVTAVTHPVLLFRRFASYKEKTFANLWAIGGPICAKDTPPALAPLLAKSKGVILDVGPGAGHQIFRFTNVNEIKAIYGAEPGESMHAALRSRAAAAGLGDKYKVLNCEAKLESLVPALVKEGVLQAGPEHGQNTAVFDEIVCLRVLCGVPNEAEVVEGLYSLLKPSGRMIVCEHVVNSGVPAEGGTRVGRFLQGLYMNLGWSFLLGGCRLKQDTLAVLKKAAEKDGGWASVDVELCDPWSTIPHIVGVLIKK